MAHRDCVARLSRRTLLRTMGAAAGAAVGGALLPRQARAAFHDSGGPGLRIGVVIPQSRLLPGLGADLLAGLRLAGAGAFRLQAATYELRQRDALAAAGELLEAGQDLIVAMMSRNDADLLAPQLDAAGVPLVVSDVGAAMLRPKRQSASVFRSSLGHWRAAWALGQWAAANVGRRALIASSFYDSGFDTVYAFWSGFERAGGERPALLVTHRPDGGADDLAAAVRAARPDMIFASYSGRAAVEFAGSYAGLGLAGRPPLLGSPFFADESWAPAQGPAIHGALSAHSWAPELSASLRPNTAFSALGYDTGLMIAAAAREGGPRGLRDALAGAELAGLRGALRLDHETQELLSPIYLRELRPGPAGPAHAIVADLTSIASSPLAVPDGPRGGWQNPYLVV